MTLLIFFGLTALWLVSWIMWGVVACGVFIAILYLPWVIWEGITYLTVNNLINAIAKIPGCFGKALAFLAALPAAGIGLWLSFWVVIQGEFMALLTAKPRLEPGAFMANYVAPLEGNVHNWWLFRFFHDHCQWLWGGADFMHSFFPWQNGVWSNLGAQLPVPMMCLKLFLLALPYMALFVIPLGVITRALAWPVIGAIGRLPSVSGNGNGD